MAACDSSQAVGDGRVYNVRPLPRAEIDAALLPRRTGKARSAVADKPTRQPSRFLADLGASPTTHHLRLLAGSLSLAVRKVAWRGPESQRGRRPSIPQKHVG